MDKIVIDTPDEAVSADEEPSPLAQSLKDQTQVRLPGLFHPDQQVAKVQALTRKLSDEDSFSMEHRAETVEVAADNEDKKSNDTGISSGNNHSRSSEDIKIQIEQETNNNHDGLDEPPDEDSQEQGRKVTLSALPSTKAPDEDAGGAHFFSSVRWETLSSPKVPQTQSKGIKLSLADLTQQFSFSLDSSSDHSESEMDDPDTKSDPDLVQDQVAKTRAKTFWEQIASRRTNRISQARPASTERMLRSARQIRNMRKKVSVNSKGKKKTTQEDLALGIVEGNLQKVEDIIEAYVGLYSGEGFRMVMSYRYDIDPRTLVINCVEKPLADRVKTLDPRGIEFEMFQGLSALHIACAFDQEQIMAYFFKFGNAVTKITTPSGQSLLHTCAWFGTAAPMQLLLTQGTNVWVENDRRQEPIHLSCMKGHVTCTKMLISAGADLEAKDDQGRTPLMEAVTASHFDCAQELIHYDAGLEHALEQASNVDIVALLVRSGADPTTSVLDEIRGEKKTIFSLFLETMPEGCLEILKRSFTSNGKSVGAKDLEVCFNYDLFLKQWERSKDDEGEITCLTDIVNAEQRDLLKHPVCESFLHMKWILVKKLFSVYLVFYIIFLAATTCLVFVDFSPTADHMDLQTKEIVRVTCSLVTLISLTLLMLKTLFLMCYNLKLYVKTYQNFNELVMIIVTVLFLIFNYFQLYSEATVHLAALTLFFSWFNFTLLLGKLPFAGIYINMIVGISKDVFTFLSLYISTLIAFALCFHIISHNNDIFKDPVTSILGTLAMMIGEIGFVDTFTADRISYHWTTEIFFTLFLLLVSIIIMNLLVGLAISNITSQFQTAGVYRLKMTVVLIGVIEEVIGGIIRFFPCCFGNTQLFQYLFNVQGAKSESLSVYLYPNEARNGTVFVKDKMGRRHKTRFKLPPWIMNNTYKILKSEHLSSSVEEAAEKRKQEDRLNKLSEEVKNTRKDLSGLKTDIQAILTYLKSSKTRVIRQ